MSLQPCCLALPSQVCLSRQVDALKDALFQLPAPLSLPRSVRSSAFLFPFDS